MDATTLIGQDSYVTGLQRQAAAQAASAQGAKGGKAMDQKKVHDAAQKFESFFVSQMLDHMTAGIETDPTFGGGHGEDTWKSMLNQEYGKEIAKSGRLGITEQVMKGMIKMQEQRDDAANALKDMPVTLSVRRPDGTEFTKYALALGASGALYQQIPLPKSSRRGRWSVVAQIDPKAPPVGRVEFSVEDFVPEKLKVELTPDAPMLRTGKTNGFASYKVADKVTSHEAWGVGVYCYFRDAAVKAHSAVEAPAAAGVKFHHLTTVWLNGKAGSEISHIINRLGGRVYGNSPPEAMRQTYTDFPGTK